ncbi:fibroblast growth factor 2-like isoform X2 [Rhopilema esculentum]
MGINARTEKYSPKQGPRSSQTRTVFDGSKSEVVNDFDADSNDANQEGPPLDIDNRPKDIRNKGEPPAHQPSATKTKKGRLVNRFHWMLKIDYLNATVTRNGEDPSSEMNVTSVGSGVVSIRGIKANKFLCMSNLNGNMFTSNELKKECIFREFQEENFHTVYRLNFKKSPWYIGINRNGDFLKKAAKRFDFGTFFQLIS